MLSVSNAKIVNRHAPKKEISFSFDKGLVNHIAYKDRYQFEFLRLKNQSLEKGEFFIDDVKIFPEENEEKAIFVLAVNSIIKFDLCFLVDKEKKQEKLEEVKANLTKLKELPITTNEEKNAKIAAIFDEICQLLPSYVLFNLNVEENQNNEELNKQLELNQGKLLFIVLDAQENKKEEEEIEEHEEFITDISIGETTTVATYKEEKPKVKVKKEHKFGKQLVLTIKENAMVFLSYLIPTIGVVAFSMLSPLYAKTENQFLLIPFIITIVVCAFLYFLMTYKCTASYFSKDALKEKKLLIYFLLNFVVTTLGAGLGVVIFILFKTFDVDLKELKIEALTYILGVVTYLLLATSCLYLGLVINKITSLGKKK